MKITTKRLSKGEYSVFKDGVYAGTISKLATELNELLNYYENTETVTGQWAAFDTNDNWLGSTHTKARGLKLCF